MIELGVKARDKVTGFVGIVTTHSRHLTGCDSYWLSAEYKDGQTETQQRCFDEIRLEVLDPRPVLVDPRRLPGSPAPG